MSEPVYTLTTTPIAPVIEWKCPKCGALPNDHRDAKEGDFCRNIAESCMGFICGCSTDQTEEHGTTFANPCTEANCYHCGWGGKFPLPPKGLTTWEKKALAAGWIPPAGRLDAPSK